MVYNDEDNDKVLGTTAHFQWGVRGIFCEKKPPKVYQKHIFARQDFHGKDEMTIDTNTFKFTSQNNYIFFRRPNIPRKSKRAVDQSRGATRCVHTVLAIVCSTYSAHNQENDLRCRIAKYFNLYP
jgi:hypothetical protein